MAECPLHGSEAALDGSPAALFCVFDGHCGRNAAEAASMALPDEVADRLAGAKEALGASAGAAALLREAFLATDDHIATEEGCTATALLMWRDHSGDVCLQAANVGDSSALLIDPAVPLPPHMPSPLEPQQTVAMLRPFASGSNSGSEGAAASPLRPSSPPPGPGEVAPGVLALTEDHRLTNPRERARLAALGIQLGDNARRLYGLNLSRGLGDKFLKDEDLGKRNLCVYR